jgi:hypothetical protein
LLDGDRHELRQGRRLLVALRDWRLGDLAHQQAGRHHQRLPLGRLTAGEKRQGEQRARHTQFAVIRMNGQIVPLAALGP